MQMSLDTYRRVWVVVQAKAIQNSRGIRRGIWSPSDQVVSMDFVIPLPRTRRVNSALLLFHDHFLGLVIAKAMNDASALEVAKAFEENTFRHFDAPSLIRHDNDHRL